MQYTILNFLSELNKTYKILPDICLTTDSNGNLIDFLQFDLNNSNFKKINDISGNIKEILPPDLAEKLKNSKIEKTWENIDIIIPLSNTQKILEFRIFANIEDRFTLCIRDITELKTKLNSVKNSSLALNTAWEQSSAGMRLLDKSGLIIDINPAFCKLVGMRPEELLGMPFYIIYDEKEASSLKEAVSEIENIFNKKTFELSTEEKLKLKNGNDKNFEVFSTLIEEDSGNSYIFSIFNEVTKRRKIEEELHKSERIASIGTMSAYISHEIKNPLATIKNYIEIMLENEDLSENIKEPLYIIQERIKHINKLLTDLLQFVRHEELIKVDVDLKILVDKIKDNMSKKLIAHNIKLNNMMNDIVILGDYMNLTSVFSNLIENSIEAINNNGTIEISGENFDDHYSVLIKDTGCGVKQSERIFDPFFTTKSSRTGLGLSIVDKIMKNHNGEIKLRSSEKGSTIFELKFIK